MMKYQRNYNIDSSVLKATFRNKNICVNTITSSELAAIMAVRQSIELFQFIQNFFCAIGIHRPEPKQIDGHFFNSTNWIFILSGTPMLLSSLAFFVYQAKTAFDFGLSFYYSSCLIFGGIFYIIYIWKVENISKFIENCETFIEQRKLNNYKII